MSALSLLHQDFETRSGARCEDGALPQRHELLEWRRLSSSVDDGSTSSSSQSLELTPSDAAPPCSLSGTHPDEQARENRGTPPSSRPAVY